jgi:hypothetical protein
VLPYRVTSTAKVTLPQSRIDQDGGWPPAWYKEHLSPRQVNPYAAQIATFKSFDIQMDSDVLLALHRLTVLHRGKETPTAQGLQHQLIQTRIRGWLHEFNID